jgi:lycopene cyclase CruA
MRARFPRTFETLSALPGGEQTIAHIDQLERGFLNRVKPTISDRGGPDAAATPDFDVVLAGGGLSLIYGAYLARRGLKVAVFDRGVIGCGHREWNISKRELQPLSASGIFSVAEVEALITLSYRAGVCRWHGGGSYPVTGVLDCVVDAEKLLSTLRARAEQAGATLLDGHTFMGYRVGPGGVAIDLKGEREVTLSARVLLDGMGASSPHASFDLCCPTVGGVLGGLEQGTDALAVDATLGEILVTTEGLEEGRQHIWEGFPSPGGRFTTYLFYYVEPAHLPAHPLWSLYERFFATLPRYKRGEAIVEKATYGFIPAYTRLRRMPAAPRDRVLLVGDAAGRHSPLTFCGFGSMIRSFLPVADALIDRLSSGRLDAGSLAAAWREPPGLQVMGGLTLMMVPGRDTGARDPSAVNALLDAAFRSLHELGDDTYGQFVRDEIGFRDFIRFMRRTARRHPTVYDEVFARLTPGEIARWTLRLARLGLTRW